MIRIKIFKKAMMNSLNFQNFTTVKFEKSSLIMELITTQLQPEQNGKLLLLKE